MNEAATGGSAARRYAGATQGAFMAAAMVVAGAFDYLVNVFVGRALPPTEFFVFVTVTALLQVALNVTNVIRNVVAYYTAESTVFPDAESRVGAVLRRSWRWAWRWGPIAMGLMAILSPAIARFLYIDTPWPILAASLTLLFFIVRPVTDGGLQGIQHFYGLGTVQMLQSMLRVVFAVLLIRVGLGASGALVALPIASVIALGLALYWLRPYFRSSPPATPIPPISWRYSLLTLAGLFAFAVLVNLDAIVVRRLFGDAAAEAYGPVVTLGKMNLFTPLGISLVLFPKATQRTAAGRDARPVLLLALGATLLPGLLLSVLYYFFPGWIVRTVFGPAYADPGILLTYVGLATTLYAATSIWLNYALSLRLRAYVVALVVIVAAQIAAMLLFHEQLETIGIIMMASGLAANVAGAWLMLARRSAAGPPAD